MTSPTRNEVSTEGICHRTTATGTQIDERQRPRDPRTAAQRETRARMAQVARTWKSMSLEQAAAWRAYAQSLAGALAPAPVPFNVFAALAMRALAVNPDAPVPVVPPCAPFSAWVSGGVVRVPAKPGVYAVAVRTVRAATGQSSALMPLGRVGV